MLHLFVALRPEASPFAGAWGLRRDPAVRGFDLYEGAFQSGDGEMPVRLVRTGIGKAHMAAGVGWLAGRAHEAGPEPAIWLNAGIAGHSRRPTGDVVMAHRVVDAANDRASYPPLVVEPPCPTCELRTVDVPETGYADEPASDEPESDGIAFDMEGSAFVDAARRFATAEVVHCVKVVSDGPGAPVHGLNRARIAELAASLVPVVEEFVGGLRPVLEQLRAAGSHPPDYEKLLESHHFTASDRVQLRRQLRRRAALVPEEALPQEAWTARRGKVANRILKDWLDGMSVR